MKGASGVQNKCKIKCTGNSRLFGVILIKGDNSERYKSIHNVCKFSRICIPKTTERALMKIMKTHNVCAKQDRDSTSYFKKILGHMAQSETCLTEDTRIVSLIPTFSVTFTQIDQQILVYCYSSFFS